MHLRHRLVVPLAAVCLTLAIAPAFAAKPDPTSVGPAGPVIQLGTINSGAALCQLGVLGPPGSLWTGLFFPPADEYFTLLDPRQCPTCHQDGYVLTNAHLQIFFPNPCALTLEVSIVPAYETTPGCWTPNPFDPPICGPVAYQLSDGGVINQCLDFSLPISAACCITGPVFLEFELTGGNCAGGEPGVCAPLACQNCTQYNYYPGATFPGTDLCVYGAPFGFNGIVMYADAECCSPTPTLPESWGMLKTLYR